jgi:prepilin-type N-terminal cleavage/methylation domain-containing protein
MPVPHGRRGFTLVEVLATMLLMAIVLPVALKGVSVALASANTARHLAEAASLADAKLQEITAAGASNVHTGTGDFGADAPGYTWQAAASVGDYELTFVTVTVAWSERGVTRTFLTSTLVGDFVRTGTASTQ